MSDTDPRPQTPDTPGDWMKEAKESDGVVMLEADDQTVFVAHIETDEFLGGEKWVANSIDPESGFRENSYATTENLIERWFSEAVPRGRAWLLEWDQTPLEADTS